jgi:hypothetical protein
VTITIDDSAHAPVAGATINGVWSGGDANGRQLVCVTDTTGRCTLQSGRLSRATDANVTFIVTNVTHPTLEYLPGSNHDPDGDSDGTSITINRPPAVMPFSDAGWLIFLPSVVSSR